MFCTSCGSLNPDGALRCSACGSLLMTPAPTDPLVSGPSLATRQGPEAEPAIASGPSGATNAPRSGGERMVAGFRVAALGDRLIALILDTVLLLAVFAVVGMWAGRRWGGVTATGFNLAGTGALVTLSIMAVAGFIYYWLSEGLAGMTLGKAMAGVKVISEQGAACGLGASVIRNILRVIDGVFLYLVGYLIAIFSRMRQRLGDHLARTYVVENELAVFPRALVVLAWIGLVGAGIWGAIALHGPGVLTTTGLTAARREADRGTAVETSPPAGREISNETTFTFPSRSTGDLKLVNFTFTTEQEGPPRPDGPYKPADDVYVKYTLTGFSTAADGRANLHYTIAAFDPTGLPLLEPTQNVVRQAVSTASFDGWYRLRLPPYVPPGTYTLQISAHDNVKNADAEITPAFVVQAPPIVPASRITLRDFHLSLTEGGPDAGPVILESSGTVYMSGKLAGMQFREDKISVKMAFELAGPKGEKLLDRPDFLTVDDSFSYHPAGFFVPISGNVNLPSGAPKGIYTEKYKVTDRNANISENYELKFEVR
jgi:uncharacterized RDD family membrane protein YckC